MASIFSCDHDMEHGDHGRSTLIKMYGKFQGTFCLIPFQSITWNLEKIEKLWFPRSESPIIGVDFQFPFHVNLRGVLSEIDIQFAWWSCSGNSCF